MAGYGSFAQVYDQLTLNVPYDQIAELYHSKIAGYGGGDTMSQSRHPEPGMDAGQSSVGGKLLADAGCGTGSLTARMARLGYDVIGADASPEMLSIAVNKPHDGVQYICQGMTELDLYGEMDVIISTLDSVNHLSSTEEIAEFFRAAALNLRKGGLLLFDVNTIYKHEKVLADNVFVYDVDGIYCVWQNEYGGADHGVDISLNIFVETEDGLYERMEEEFREIAIEREELERMLRNAGFALLGVSEYLTDREPAEDSEKLLFCAKKL